MEIGILKGVRMKKGILLSVTAAMLSFTNLAQADFTIYLGSSDACSTIAGKWLGSGRVYNWLVDCQYQGEGTISNVDSAGNFTLDMNSKKTSGSILCPSTYNNHFGGRCSNGSVTIVTGSGDLTGSFSNNAGSAKGTITVSGIQATLELSFNKP